MTRSCRFMIHFMGRPKVADMGYGSKRLFTPSYFSHCLCCFWHSLIPKQMSQAHLPSRYIIWPFLTGYPFHFSRPSQPLLLFAPCFQYSSFVKLVAEEDISKILEVKILPWVFPPKIWSYTELSGDQDGPTEHSLAVKQGIYWNRKLPVICA